MRLKLTLQKTGSQSTLPINYAYPLSSWIYKVIGKADETYADFLHNSGYSAGQKRFKFFTLSALGKIPTLKCRNRITHISNVVLLSHSLT
ncbi:hypothetical protein QNI19_28635 [Cytophagaceae bacterium DM2B3-1]|uniref:Uncharacterized protein n=1 Tax=Xanthocytophaga flava TaxID=3048013 RepID=A0ABT7CT86_9BACT|nr:hypothetical protein [Xanthocytophaga flavus]MDJ1496937.1 hypothetical protein [Xanthocytophaga flavus]